MIDMYLLAKPSFPSLPGGHLTAYPRDPPNISTTHKRSQLASLRDCGDCANPVYSARADEGVRGGSRERCQSPTSGREKQHHAKRDIALSITRVESVSHR